MSVLSACEATQATAYSLVDQSETLPCLLTGGIYARLNKAIRKETNEFGYSFSSIGFDTSTKLITNTVCNTCFAECTLCVAIDVIACKITT